jgi:hypothetical protein
MPTQDAIGEKGEQNCFGICEGDYDLLQQLGSVSTVTNYLTTILSRCIILFQNDGIDTKVNELKNLGHSKSLCSGDLMMVKADDYLVTSSKHL